MESSSLGIAHAPLTPVSAGVDSRSMLEEGLRRLAFLLPQSAVQYSKEAIDALSAEAQSIAARGYAISFDLLALVDGCFREALRDGARSQVDVADVARLRGITGILRD